MKYSINMVSNGGDGMILREDAGWPHRSGADISIEVLGVR